MHRIRVNHKVLAFLQLTDISDSHDQLRAIKMLTPPSPKIYLNLVGKKIECKS